MGAMDVLAREHRAIEIVLNTMEKAADALDAGKDVDVTIVAECMDFVVGFVDQCHHVKEEELLFPLLQERGVTREGGPIGQMLHEHNEGRELSKKTLRSLDKWREGKPDARYELAESLRNYTRLLRSHIFKEDNVLFAVASGVLSDEDNKRLEQGFEDIEEKKIGPGVHEEYHTMLEELQKRAEEL